jgi:atypical dual specificity phosphatase
LHPKLSKALFVPTFAWNYLLGRVVHARHWWDEVDPQVLLGAMPLHSDPQRLFDIGVRGVVNTCKEYAGPTAKYQRLGIEQLWIPTVDFNPPSVADIQLGVDFIQKHVEQGHKVYVHCKAGRARSATIVICWLVAHRKMTLAEAQRHLLKCRPHVNAALMHRTVVHQFCQSRFKDKAND